MKLPDRGGEPERGVAVFGSAEADPGSELFESARVLGAAIASSGLPAVTGGYGGVMEGASRGAREAGGEVIGVTTRVFRGRSPNRYLTLEIEEPDLFSRTARLVALSRAFVVLGGGAGTLAELGMLWALARARQIDSPIVLWDPVWARMRDELAREGRLDARCLALTSVVASAGEAVRLALAGAPRRP